MIKRLLGVVLAASLCWGLQGIDGSEDQYVRRLTGPLVNAGIPVSDEFALIRALHQRDNRALAVSAAYALRRLPKSELAVRELNAAVLADDETLMMYAIESLVALGDSQWVNAATSRLPNIKSEFVRVSVAGQLAGAGVYDGWRFVASAITRGNTGMRFEGLQRIREFRGMKDPSGVPFDLVLWLSRARSESQDPAAKADLLRAINDLTMPGPLPPSKAGKRSPGK